MGERARRNSERRWRVRFNWLGLDSLCYLCVLCVSVVRLMPRQVNRRGAKNTENEQEVQSTKH